MRCWMLLSITGLLLSACATTPSEVVTCPALKPYSDAEQLQAMKELSVLDPDAELRVFMDDYGDLRAQVRACNAVK